MSVLQNPIVGRMKQKIGGVVMSTWKGINVMRGKPLTVANPKTDPQLMRRSALRQIVAIARKLIAAIDFGFKEQAVKKSAFNAFTGYNLRNAFSYAAPPAATIQTDNVLVAQGTIAPTELSSAPVVAAGGTVDLAFPTTALLPGQSASDVAICVLYNTVSQAWDVPVATSPNLRSDGVANYDTPAETVATENVRVFTFFYNPTQRKSSDSINQVVAAT